MTTRRGFCSRAALIALVAAICVMVSPVQAQPRMIRLPSRILGETRVLHISLPSNYRFAKQRYPVVILLDGQVRAFFDLTVASVGYNLVSDVHDAPIPAQIVVGVEQSDRGADLTRNDVAFTQFLTDELIPYLDREFRTVPYRTLIGHSLGGRFALLAQCRAPELFSSVVAISPSISDSVYVAVHDCLRVQFAAAARSRAPRVRSLTLSAGSLESRATASVDRLFSFARDSAPATFRVQRVDGTGLGHTDTPFTTIPASIRFAFASEVWEITASAADSLLTRRGNESRVLTAALETVSARVGFRLEPSSKWMGAVTGAYLARGPVDSAIASAQRLVDRYPEDITSYTRLADAHLMRNDVAAARRALVDALAIAEKVDWFDETPRAKQMDFLKATIAGLRLTNRTSVADTVTPCAFTF